MAKVTAYIIAFNEENKIAAAIESVLWADEVILCDSNSTDRTAEIGASYPQVRVEQVPFDGFGKLRNNCLELCSNEWIFSLDADERCTPEAEKEIRAIMADPDALDAYYTPRRNYFMGKWIKYSGWYPDYRQPQLFKKGLMRYTEEQVHEGFICDTKPGYMKSDIWQFPFENLSQIQNKANRYSALGAEKYMDRGTQGSMSKALIHGIGAFLRHYIIRKGFLDGWAGFVIAVGNFDGTFFKYAKLTAIQKGWDKQPDGLPKKAKKN